MKLVSHKFLLAALGCIVLVLLLSGSRLRNDKVDAKVPTSSPRSVQTSTASMSAATLPPPTADDIRAAIARVYGDAVQIGDSLPHYLVGDFNGDGSQDLVVEVRPSATKVSDLNGDLANWIVEDPSQIFVPDPSKAVQSFPPIPPRQLIHKSQPLLVVLHGYGSQGWRAPSARQSYLLANATGNSIVRKAKDDAMLTKVGKRPMPRLLGDVIYETRADAQGFLFWTGGHYAWYQQ